MSETFLSRTVIRNFSEGWKWEVELDQEAQLYCNVYHQRRAEMIDRTYNTTIGFFKKNLLFEKKVVDEDLDGKIQVGRFKELWVWKPKN